MKNFSIIGIGETGKYVINKIEEENNDIDTIYLNIAGDEIKECKAKKIITLKNNVDELMRIKFKSKIFIINHLGDKNTDKINQLLCSVIKSEENEIYEICSFPATFEGKSRLTNATETIKKLGEELNRIIITDGDLILRYVDRRITILEFFNMLYDILYINLKNFSKGEQMQYQKLIVDFKAKGKEMSEKIIRYNKLEQELKDICCIGFRRKIK